MSYFHPYLQVRLMPRRRTSRVPFPSLRGAGGPQLQSKGLSPGPDLRGWVRPSQRPRDADAVVVIHRPAGEAAGEGAAVHWPSQLAPASVDGLRP